MHHQQRTYENKVWGGESPWIGAKLSLLQSKNKQGRDCAEIIHSIESILYSLNDLKSLSRPILLSDTRRDK